MSVIVEGGDLVGTPKSRIIETEIDNEISLYDPKTERVTLLNATASDVWRLLDGEHDLEAITALLASAYRVRASEIAGDIAKTVDQITEAGLIENP